MKKTEVLILLEKYRLGIIGKDELDRLESWYIHWKPEDLEISTQELESIKETVWGNIHKDSVRTNGTKVKLWSAIIAAAVILIIAIPVSYLSYESFQTQPPAESGQSVFDFKPGENIGVLTLADGRDILLTGEQKGTLAYQQTAVIRKMEDGLVVYEISSADKSNTGAEVYNIMTTPRGGNYRLRLSDGTQVWLNAASSIKFPVNFKNGDRKVIVKGEAYFEVAHVNDKPFKVITANQEVTVLGTHFNIKGYEDDMAISTTLLEGSIKIKNLKSGKSSLMKPGQQAGIFKNQNEIEIRRIHAEEVVSWKKGYFIFDDQSIEGIMKTLGRWYDADIEYYGDSQERFGGTFSRSSNLAEILTNLEQLGKVQFTIKGKKIIVTETGKEVKKNQIN